MPRLLLFLGMTCLTWNLNAQCPGCIVDIPASFPADTIYLDAAPDGQVGVEYDEDLSFRMPLTTDPVAAIDPDVPPGLSIDQIVLTGITGLPPGMDWEPNQTVFNTSIGESDGCVKICGTPIQPDSFFINVLIEATVFGLPANSSFAIPIYIAPAIIQTDGFSMENNIGCGSTTVEFTNSIPSNGNPGYSYSWDFGNGETSIDEDPGSVTYNTPGTYEVNYMATIDTAQAILTGVTVVSAGCDDIAFPPNDAPDLYLEIYKPDGTLAFITPIQDNVAFPTVFDLFIPLEPGNYEIVVIDDDLIGSQACGDVNFTEDTDELLISGDLQLTVSILNPIVNIESTGTVTVFEIPDAPVITGSDGNNSFCTGDSLLMNVNYADGIQWFQDSLPIIGATTDEIYATEAGDYWVTYTSPDGCQSTSDIFTVTIDPAPLIPTFSNTNNLLSVIDTDALPVNFELAWFEDGILIPGENSTELCIVSSGTYTLQVTDLDSGCTALYTATETYDANLSCTDNAIEILAATTRIYPNPNNGEWQLDIPELPDGPINIRFMDLQGRIINFWQLDHFGGDFNHYFQTNATAGAYILMIEHAEGVFQKRLILQ